MSPAVVVGVSPTSGSPGALRWAAQEASLRGLPLRAVMAWRNPPAAAASGTRPPMPPRSDPAQRAADAEHILREFVQTALGPDQDVDCSVVKGSALNALLTEAAGAALLVVGEPGPGRVAGMRVGLVAPQLVTRAGCPVVVMPAAAAAAG